MVTPTSTTTVVHEDGTLEIGDLQPSDSGRYRCRVDIASGGGGGARSELLGTTTATYGDVIQLDVDSSKLINSVIRFTVVILRSPIIVSFALTQEQSCLN